MLWVSEVSDFAKSQKSAKNHVSKHNERIKGLTQMVFFVAYLVSLADQFNNAKLFAVVSDSLRSSV